MSIKEVSDAPYVPGESTSPGLSQSVPELYSGFRQLSAGQSGAPDVFNAGSVDFSQQQSLYGSGIENFTPGAPNAQLGGESFQVPHGFDANNGATSFDNTLASSLSKGANSPKSDTGDDTGGSEQFKVPYMSDASGSSNGTDGGSDGQSPGGGKKGSAINIDGNNDTVTIDGDNVRKINIDGSNDNVNIVDDGDGRAPKININGNNDNVTITKDNTGTGNGTAGDGGAGNGTSGDGGAGSGSAGDGGSANSNNPEIQQIEQQLQQIQQELQQLVQELGQLTGDGAVTGGGGGTTGGGGTGGDGGGGTTGGGGTGGDGGGGTTGGGGTGGDGGGGTTGGGGTGGGLDMSSVIQAGAGVTSQEVQQAIAVEDSLPKSIQQAMLNSGAQITLETGYQPGEPQGENNGTQGDVFVDSGMATQALIHESAEMAGQTTNGVPGLWDDPTTISMADQAMNAMGSQTQAQIGDLNDTVGNVQGDGDLISNVIAGLVTANNPTADGGDSYGQDIEQLSMQAAPQLTQYIAQSLGLNDPYSSQATA